MDLEMVLNELSLRIPADDIQTARLRMSGLIDTLSAATRDGVKKVLRTHDNLNDVPLAPGYSLVKWRNDSNVSREARSFFRTLMTKLPLLVDVVNPEINNKNAMSQFWHQGVEAKGLGVAHLLDALAISLMSDAQWNSSYLGLTSIELNDDGELGDKSNIDVVHASRREHILEHADWISERKEYRRRVALATIYDGIDLWMRKEELFPRLQFCRNVESQLRNVLHGQLLLQSITK